jgi:hypothetical protein
MLEDDRMPLSPLRLPIKIRLLPRWCWLVVVAIGLFGTVQIVPQLAERSDFFSPRCEEWDRAASAAMAAGIAERDPVLEQKLGDALFRLRRARKYCRLDLVGLARLDYEALTGGRYHHSR